MSKSALPSSMRASAFRYREGTASFDAAVLLVCVAVLGAAGWARLGRELEASIAGNRGGSSAGAPNGPLSSQAGVASAAKRVLVLGGTGTIGAAVVDAASKARDVHVTAVARNAPPRWLEKLFERSNVEFRAGDIFDASQAGEEFRRQILGNADVTVLSAEPYPMHAAGVEPAVRGVQRLLESALASGYAKDEKTFVRVGSPPGESGRFVSARGGDVRGTTRWEEQVAPELDVIERFPYLKTKYSNSLVAHELSKTEGLRVVSALPTSVVSWYNTLGKFDAHVEYARDSRMAAIANYPVDHVAADDAARGILMLAEKGEPGRLYHLGGETLPVGDVLVRVLREAGLHRVPSIIQYPRDVLAAEEKLLRVSRGQGLDGMLYNAARMWMPLLMPDKSAAQLDLAVEVMRLMGSRDSSRARALGYNPTTSVSEAVSRKAAFLRENGLVR